MSKSFHELLRYHRRQTYDPARGRFLSVERFGDMVGVSGAAVSDWERGAYRPDAQNRALLVKIILTLFTYQGLQQINEADELLQAGGYAPLRQEEIATIWLEQDGGPEEAPAQPESVSDLGPGAAEEPTTADPAQPDLGSSPPSEPDLGSSPPSEPLSGAQLEPISEAPDARGDRALPQPAPPAVQPGATAGTTAATAPGPALMVALMLALLVLLYLVAVTMLGSITGAAGAPQTTSEAARQPSATGPVLSPAPSPTTRLSDFTVAYSVAADQPWQDTGIQIVAGDQVEISYLEGSWTENSRDTPLSGPGGILPALAAPCDLPLPSEVAGYNVLVGKIGQGKPFKVGGAFKETMQAAGSLYLRLNDCDDKLDDNEGTIKLKILVRR